MWGGALCSVRGCFGIISASVPASGDRHASLDGSGIFLRANNWFASILDTIYLGRHSDYGITDGMLNGTNVVHPCTLL